MLGRSVDKRVLEHLLKDPDLSLLTPERALVTVLFAHIRYRSCIHTVDLLSHRDATSLAERTDAELLGNFLNNFLSEMSRIVVEHHVSLFKYIFPPCLGHFR